MLASASRARPSFTDLRPGLAHAVHLLEIAHRRPHDLLQAGEVLDDPVDEGSGKRGSRCRSR